MTPDDRDRHERTEGITVYRTYKNDLRVHSKANARLSRRNSSTFRQKTMLLTYSLVNQDAS